MWAVVLVEDHRLVRDGVRSLLERSGEFTVVGEAGDGAEAVQLVRQVRPHIVLMDIGLPAMNGIEATSEILRHCPETKVIMLSLHDDEQTIVAAVRSGARGYIVKSASGDDLLEALRSVARGGSYLSPPVSDRLLRRIREGEARPHAAAGLLETLSPRELQVLRLVAQGKTSKDIAVLLDLGLQTVRGYRKAMMKKLGVNNVAGLTQIAVSCGLTPLERN